MANPLMGKGLASLNPQGRPKGLALRIREATNGLEEQLRFLIELSAGLQDGSNKDRIEATKILLERAYGKALEIHAVGALSEEQRETAQELTREQLLALVTVGGVGALPTPNGSGVVDGELVGPEAGPASVQVPDDTGSKD